MRSISESISSLDSSGSDGSSVRQLSDPLSTAPTPLSTAPQSSSSSVKSVSYTSGGKERRSSLKSSLRTSKSASSLVVRFVDPEPPPPMPSLEWHAPIRPHQDGPFAPKAQDFQMRTSWDLGTRPPVRMRSHKHLSTPAPISRRESKTFNAPTLPLSPNHSIRYSTRTSYYTPRVTSFQSFASAPAVLQSSPTPSGPPSQYNPLDHYVPCLAPNCTSHYTSSLIGWTFYSPQSPYQLTRKHGLCPFHAHQDLKLANHRVKSTYESMRQNCGRKTLGTIAAEFETFVQQIREERVEDSLRMKAWQRQRVLGSAAATGTTKGKERTWEEEWDWRFSPRPCSKRGCAAEWYCPFDNRLYLFYTTHRPSGLLPLSTMCPSCAKEDVEGAEERIEERKMDAGGVLGPEWEEWCEQVGRDREMEVEFWEGAQEKAVKEKMGSTPVIRYREEKDQKIVREKKSRSRKKLDVCVVM